MLVDCIDWSSDSVEATPSGLNLVCSSARDCNMSQILRT